MKGLAARGFVLASIVLLSTATGAGGAAESLRPEQPSGHAPVEPDIAPQQNNTSTLTVPRDPSDDVLGWENGYWYNESISVNQSDGLTAVETEAYLSRMLARTEHLRRLEFKEDVEVEVLSRQEFRNETVGIENDTVPPEPPNASNETLRFWEWNNQVWEGIFIVGEDTDVSDAFDELSAGAVLGFYEPDTDRLVVVSDNPDTPVIDNVTLIHELVHALQDQHYNLSSSEYRANTQDGELATGGLIEGDASYVELLYIQKCQTEWDCVGTPPAATGNTSDGPPEFNVGMLVVLLNQYSDGAAFVHQLVSQQGWDAVDALYEDSPDSTEQIIHVEPDEEPAPIEFESNARNGWELFEEQGESGSDTVGEASIYSMLWYQGFEYNISLVNGSAFFEPEQGEFDTYNYTSAPSAGWANDRLFPYKKGDEFGYVWLTEWDTRADARQFYETYLSMLRGHGANRIDENVWVIKEGPFADAFYVELDDTSVTVVNGPTEGDLEDIRPSIDAGDGNVTSGG